MTKEKAKGKTGDLKITMPEETFDDLSLRHSSLPVSDASSTSFSVWGSAIHRDKGEHDELMDSGTAVYGGKPMSHIDFASPKKPGLYIKDKRVGTVSKYCVTQHVGRPSEMEMTVMLQPNFEVDDSLLCNMTFVPDNEHLLAFIQSKLEKEIKNKVEPQALREIIDLVCEYRKTSTNIENTDKPIKDPRQKPDWLIDLEEM